MLYPVQTCRDLADSLLADIHALERGEADQRRTSQKREALTKATENLLESIPNPKGAYREHAELIEEVAEQLLENDFEQMDRLLSAMLFSSYCDDPAGFKHYNDLRKRATLCMVAA
jgi:hypothetical protein